MHVPFIDLTRSIKKIHGKVMASWEGALERAEFIQGPAVTELERRLSRFFATHDVVGCSNGTDAILVALQAMGVKPGMRIAMPNLTFWAPYEAIVLCGAQPVLIDSDPADLQMKYDEFVAAWEASHFEAVIFVHLFGWTSAVLKKYREFCRERGILMLEDGAQAFGVTINGGEPLFTNCDTATMSFYPAKVFGGAGDGGAILVNSAERATEIRSLVNHGRADHYRYRAAGWNARMGSIQAHYLIHMLDEVPDMITSRHKAMDFYRDFFAVDRDIVEIHTPPAGVNDNGYLCVMTAPGFDGDTVVAALRDKGIGCARTYPETIDQQQPAAGSFRVSDLTHSRNFCRSVFNLPLFAGIREDELVAAGQALRDVLRKPRIDRPRIDL